MTSTSVASPPGAAGFAVVYSPDLAQYVVERGEMRVVPTRATLSDPRDDCQARALQMCAVLNRVYQVTTPRVV